MANLISNETAQWLHNQMSPGGVSFKPRRIMHKGGGNGVSDVVLCITKTVPTTATEGYEVDLYANGLAADPTDTGILYLPEISAHTKLPAGTCILAHICEATYTQSDARGDVIGG